MGEGGGNIFCRLSWPRRRVFVPEIYSNSTGKGAHWRSEHARGSEIGKKSKIFDWGYWVGGKKNTI